MKCIIAGSRGINDKFDAVCAAIASSGFTISEVVSGGARGVDRLGELYANMHRLPVRCFKPDWQLYGRSAGIRRNSQMAKYADALIAIWDGKSPGTANMIKLAKASGLKVYVHEIKE